MPAIVSPAALSRPVLLIALVCGALLATTLTLWVYFGTAVFFGMLGVTLFGLLFTPVFYVLVRAMAGGKGQNRAGPPRTEVTVNR